LISVRPPLADTPALRIVRQINDSPALRAVRQVSAQVDRITAPVRRIQALARAARGERS
jgi:hypothetical protein